MLVQMVQLMWINSLFWSLKRILKLIKTLLMNALLTNYFTFIIEKNRFEKMIFYFKRQRFI